MTDDLNKMPTDDGVANAFGGVWAGLDDAQKRALAGAVVSPISGAARDSLAKAFAPLSSTKLDQAVAKLTKQNSEITAAADRLRTNLNVAQAERLTVPTIDTEIFAKQARLERQSREAAIETAEAVTALAELQSDVISLLTALVEDFESSEKANADRWRWERLLLIATIAVPTITAIVLAIVLRG